MDNQDNIISFLSKSTKPTAASKAVIKIKNQQGSINLEFHGDDVVGQTEKILTLFLQSNPKNEKSSAK